MSILFDTFFQAIVKGERVPPPTLMQAIKECLDEIEDQGPPESVVVSKTLEAIGNLLDYFPPSAWVTHKEFIRVAENRPQIGPTVPLYDILTNPGEAILNLCGTVFYRELLEKGYLPKLRKQLLDNENAASGISTIDRVLGRKQVVGSDEYEAEPEELVRIYTRYTPFFPLLHTQIPFRIPRERWPTHAIIIAPSEWGKSELLGLFLRDAVEDKAERAVLLCDPHGDLYNKALPRIPPERLIAIDLKRNPPDLNILDRSVMSERSALDTFKFLMSSLAGGLSPKQEQAIKTLFALLNKIEGANLFTLHEIITEPAKRPTKFKEPIDQLEPLHRTFFETLWYSGNYQETKDALTWKVSAALDDPTFYKMFTAPRNSMTISRWIEERRVVLVKSSDQLDKEGTRLFFLYLIGQYYAAAMRRDAIPEQDRHLAMLFFDEASVVLQSPVIADILTGIRKYNCSFVAATQLWQHVAMDVRPAILGSCGTRILGQLGHDEASALYRDQKMPLDTIMSLNAFPRQYAEWSMFVRSVTKQGKVVRAPYGALEAMPKQKAAPVQERPSTPIQEQLPPASDIHLVVTTTRRIETLLENHYGATGRGLIEKMKSIESSLPRHLIHALRYIGEMWNKVVHEEFSLPNREWFLDRAQLFDDHFADVSKTVSRAESGPAEPPSKKPDPIAVPVPQVAADAPNATKSTIANTARKPATADTSHIATFEE